MGTQLPSQKRGRAPSPQFLAHVYCGQTAGWIKTPLGTEVDLGPGHFVLDGFPAIGERGTADPSFPPMPIAATVAHLSYCWALVFIGPLPTVSEWKFHANPFGNLCAKLLRDRQTDKQTNNDENITSLPEVMNNAPVCTSPCIGLYTSNVFILDEALS